MLLQNPRTLVLTGLVLLYPSKVRRLFSLLQLKSLFSPGVFVGKICKASSSDLLSELGSEPVDIPFAWDWGVRM